MAKDREKPSKTDKGKPSGANKSEPELPAGLPVRHPNRNTSKGEEFSKTESTQNKSRNETYTEDFTDTIPEELSGNLTKELFVELAAYNQPPCISILMPTHKAGMEVNEQLDMTAFKSALQQAEKALKEKGADQMLIKKMLKPGYDLLRDDKFWYAMSDGLAVYIADGLFRFLKLRAPLVQHVVVNNSFYVSPLVPFMVRPEYFYILDIAKKFPRFYRADALGIEHLQVEELPAGVSDVVHFEEKGGKEVFRTGDTGGTGSASYHGIGAGRPDEKENIKLYLEEVDDTIWKSHLNKENVPLLLAGQDFLIPIYRSVSDYKNIWPEALTGNHHQQNDNELYEDAMKVMTPFFEQPLRRALDDYGNRSATDLTSTNLSLIIPAAYYSRVSHLFVRKGSRIWGMFNEQENKLDILDHESDTVEDLIDKAVIKTIQNGGEVYFLEANEMPEPGELAAIFRY
ncbi:baeRF7 domain-containing protein [Niastella populi]|uniref:Uncharacterized protein n=1 Tax=Niastella populi TaxID=550983 RepID=A0A1V9FZF0_9BACT|nr:hypothetical protein [Niastella populi]OQP63648.1 hypothetical protein A4R26_16895 [Niastella populi]